MIGRLAAVLFLLGAGVTALNNGLGQTPAMGYSTWNDCSSFRDNGPGGWCASRFTPILSVLMVVCAMFQVLGCRTACQKCNDGEKVRGFPQMQHQLALLFVL
jgi:hypothetical protein